MAPERFGGGTYDFVSDVWSVGVITLEALSGQHPYKDRMGNFIAISMAVCKQPAPMPPSGTPPEICDFVSRCLAKEHRGAAAREPVRALINGRWMRECSRQNVQRETRTYLREQKGLPAEDDALP